MYNKPEEIFEELMERYPSLRCCSAEIYDSYKYIVECYANGGKLLCCGNGGSAADSDHLVGELMKGFLLKRPLSEEEADRFSDKSVAYGLQKGLPAISLAAQSAVMTAFNNDCDPSLVFAQQVYGYGHPGDVLIGFSTSGNSKNVVNALIAAEAAGMISIAITGDFESKSTQHADICIRLPEKETFKIQELTLPVYHCLAAMTERYFFER